MHVQSLIIVPHIHSTARERQRPFTLLVIPAGKAHVPRPRVDPELCFASDYIYYILSGISSFQLPEIQVFKALLFAVRYLK